MAGVATAADLGKLAFVKLSVNAARPAKPKEVARMILRAHRLIYSDNQLRCMESSFESAISM